MSAEQLTHLCRLANVAEPADDAARADLRRDLGLMLTFVRHVQHAADHGVEPLASVAHADPPRLSGADAPPAPADALPLPRDELLANATETRDGFYVVRS